MPYTRFELDGMKRLELIGIILFLQEHEYAMTIKAVRQAATIKALIQSHDDELDKLNERAHKKHVANQSTIRRLQNHIASLEAEIERLSDIAAPIVAKRVLAEAKLTIVEKSEAA